MLISQLKKKFASLFNILLKKKTYHAILQPTSSKYVNMNA
jgi:hypothetical protein